MKPDIRPYLKNKYLVTLFVFVLWITFFDQNNLLTQVKYRIELMGLEDEREYYQGEIAQTRKDLTELTTDMNNLERFAREKYLMKRDDEEVFVFVRE